jgi:GNAT superfamily N-acetyltransferase
MSADAITLKRTDNYDPDFKQLIALLDEYLAMRNGEEHSFYAPNNKLDRLDTAIIAYQNSLAVGCGCFKKIDSDTIEIKRMYVKTEIRGKGIASKILGALEAWAKELNYKYSILETGVDFDDAVNLYKKAGYDVIDNYGPYVGKTKSLCLQKIL